MVRWLRLCPPNAGGMGSIPGQGTKITACCTDRAPPKKAESTPPAKKEVLAKSLSRVRLFATPWSVAYHAPPSIGFSKQEYWSGLPFPSPGNLPDPGIEPRSPAL